MKAELILGIIFIVILLIAIVSVIILLIGDIIRRRKYNRIIERGRELLKDYYNDHPEKVGDYNYIKYKNL
jgi:hypothetical protein